MNGLKLQPGKKSNKNSFVYQNQFEDFELQSEDLEEEQDGQQESQQPQSEAPKKQSQAKEKLSEVVGRQKIPEQIIQIVDKPINNQKQTPKPKPNQQKAVGVKSIENPQKADSEMDKKITTINDGKEKLQVSIVQMKENLQEIKATEALLKQRNERKQSQIKQFLSDKQKQKLLMQKKKEEQLRKEKEKQQQAEIRERQEKSRKQRQKVEQNLRRVLEMKQKRQAQRQRQQEQRRLINQSNMNNSLIEGNRKRFFHLQKQKEDEQKRQQQEERKKEILIKRKEVYRSLDFDDIQQHARKHYQLAHELIEAKKAKRFSEYEKIREANKQIGPVYRGESHQYVKQQLKQIKERLEAPKVKSDRIKQYEKHVKQNYLPKTHQPKSSKSIDFDDSRGNLSHREVRRYRYVKGVAYGQIKQKRPLVKSEAEQRDLGNNYLQYLKSLPKKKQPAIEQSNLLTIDDIAVLDKKLNSITRVKPQTNPLYEQSARRSLEVRISSKPTRDELNAVIEQLRSRDQQTKLKQKVVKYQSGNSQDLSFQQRSLNEEIVSNIERKLNLLAKL